jgi:hypothetical protein
VSFRGATSDEESRLELIERRKEHVLATLRALLPECAPGGQGLRNKDIETACGFALSPPRQDGWSTWSLPMALVQDKKIDFTSRGQKARDSVFSLDMTATARRRHIWWKPTEPIQGETLYYLVWRKGREWDPEAFPRRQTEQPILLIGNLSMR